MKINVAKFGTLMSFISNKTDRVLCYHDSDEILQMISDMVEQSEPVNLFNIDQLMKYMHEGMSKIEAIRAYRTLTGLGLKESKDAVEKYWVDRQVNEFVKAGFVGGSVKED